MGNYIFEDLEKLEAKIKVIGVGGGGGNTINTMIEENVEGVEFIAANTDAKDLKNNKAPIKLQIGAKLTKGLGAGANPEIGRSAALEDAERIKEILEDTDMLFVTAGMGGGTGTGAAPVIASIAKELDILTVAVVTKPFLFEGKRRMKHADMGINELKKYVDALIIIPNQRILSICGKNLTLKDSFKMVDLVLVNAVRGISELITTDAYIQLDFADVKAVMSERGMALMGIGGAQGENRAIEAAQMAISSPLLEDISIHGAKGILINITGSSDMTMMEIQEACSMIQEAAHEDANIIFGVKFNDNLQDELRVTIIATGFENEEGYNLNSPNRINIIDTQKSNTKKVANSGINYDLGDDLDHDIYDIPTFLRRKPD